MPLYEMECSCGHRFEEIAGFDERHLDCPECGGVAKRIPSCARICVFNDDADWVRRQARTIVDPLAMTPEEKDLYKNPTRSKLLPYMEKRGVQPHQPGKKVKEDPVDVDRYAHKICQKQMERNRIEVRS